MKMYEKMYAYAYKKLFETQPYTLKLSKTKTKTSTYTLLFYYISISFHLKRTLNIMYSEKL